jgi:hypothetical protein
LPGGEWVTYLRIDQVAQDQVEVRHKSPEPVLDDSDPERALDNASVAARARDD